MPFTGVLFIIAALVALAAVLAIIATKARSAGGWLVLTGAVLVAAFSSVTIVGAAVGVPVTFGKAGDPLESGLHFRSPFTSVATYPTRNSDRICLDAKEEGSGLIVKTAEQGQLTVRPCLSYRINPEAASDIWKVAKSSDALQNTVVEPYAMQAVTATFSRMTNEEATSSKIAELPDLIRADVSDLLEEQGIELVTFFVPAPTPSEKMQEWIDAKLGANQKLEQAKIDQERSAVENATKVAAAEAQAQANQIITQSASREALCQSLINVLGEKGNIGTVLADPCSPEGATRPEVIVGATPVTQ